VTLPCMGLVRMRMRAERRAPRRWIGAILLLALAGSASLIAAQAARRTDTAFNRALAAGKASDAIVNADTSGKNKAQTAVRRASGMKILDAIDRSPLVVAHGREGGAMVFRVVDSKIDGRLTTTSAFGHVALDDQMGRTVSRPRIYSGRLPTPRRADEITISRETEAITDWHVGSLVTDVRVFNADESDTETFVRPGTGTPLRLHVVGVVESPEDLLLPVSDRTPRISLTPAFAQRYPDSVFYLTDRVVLRNGGRDIPALRAAVATANKLDPGIDTPIALTAQQLTRVNRANDPLVNGLWILAFLFGLVGILLAAQSLGRSLASGSDEHAQLRALGATRGQRYAVEIATLAVVALTAAVLAAIVAFLFSPFTPIGTARPAEPNGGFSLNLVLTGAAVATIFVGTMLAALPALHRVVNTTALPGAVGTTDRTPRVSRTAELVGHAGLGSTAVIGARLALQPGRGASATPVRSVLASLILVVATVTATFSFGVNLQRWTSTPRLYGWNWDAAAGTNFGAIPPDFEEGLRQFPNVAELSALTIGRMTIAGHAIPAIGIDQLRGHVAPDIDEGRLPENTHEIVLGVKTLRAIHQHVGDTVTATIGDQRATLRIVGRTTFPAFGNERGGESGLGTGALGTAARFPVVDPTAPGGRYSYMLMRFASGTAAKSEGDLRKALLEGGCDASCLLTDSRPVEIDGYRNVRRLPLTIGLVLVLLLVATLTHVLVSTMRRRRGDLAILRALGCTTRNLVSILRWQSAVLTAAGIVIGIPLGLIANHLAWNAFTSQLGIAPGTVSPIAAIGAGAAGLLLLALLLATIVGRRARVVTRRFRLSEYS
jgi:hypothetical protein